GMRLLSHSETVNQAGSFRKRRALDGLVFSSFDSRVHASPRRTKTQHVSAAATELILRRSSTGRDHPPMETGRPEFGHREYLRAYRTDDRVYGLSMGRYELTSRMRPRPSAYRRAIRCYGRIERERGATRSRTGRRRRASHEWAAAVARLLAR